MLRPLWLGTIKMREIRRMNTELTPRSVVGWVQCDVSRETRVNPDVDWSTSGAIGALEHTTQLRELSSS